MRGKNFSVELSHELTVGILKKLRNVRFSMEHLIFYDQFRSPKTLLFYTKQKVWVFPDILSPFPALCD
mgnify:CR=1 FL=1